MWYVEGGEKKGEEAGLGDVRRGISLVVVGGWGWDRLCWIMREWA